MKKSVMRADLLATLQSCQAGLTPADTIEQSSCFVFKDAEVITFNEEIMCRNASGLPAGITGAVAAKPLLAMLGKMTEEEIEIDTTDTEFLVRGRRRRSGLVLQPEIALPYDGVPNPGSWLPLTQDFTDAVSLVQECAGKDSKKNFILTCVHWHPKWIEACDGNQMTRYRLKVGLEKPVLLRRDTIKAAVALGVSQFNESESWVHFGNPSGLVVSCKRYYEDYPKLSSIVKNEDGEPATLPKGLKEAADRAEVFSQEDADNNKVLVKIRNGKLSVRGTGNTGYYCETKKIISTINTQFMIGPKILREITDKHNECRISEKMLRIDGGAWVYVVSLTEEEPSNEDKSAAG